MSAVTTSEPTPAKRFCGECGALLGPGDRFCGTCGAPLEEPRPEASTQHEVATSRVAQPTLLHTAAASAASWFETGRATAARWRDALGALACTIGVWAIGWLTGGVIGTYIFAEMWRGTIPRSAPFPGIATAAPFGTSAPAYVTGIDGEGILFWGFCGMMGGTIAAIITVLGDRRNVSISLRGSAVATLIWIVTVAGVINGALYALPLLGAVNGALFVRRDGVQGRAALRSVLTGGLGWLVGTIFGYLLIWAYQES